MQKSQSIFCLVVFAVCLTACSKPYLKPQTDPANASFPGILDGVRAANQTRADVILIHGMCSHEVLGHTVACIKDPKSPLCRDAWVLNANKTLAHSAGLSEVNVEAPRPIGKDGALLFDGTLSGKDIVLRTHAIVWSPISASYKKRLCYDVTGKTDVCQDPNLPYRRSGLN